MSAYTPQQQAFALSMLTGKVDSLTGTASHIEASLAPIIDGFLNGALSPLIGQWKRVWGPAVWQNTGGSPPSTYADNTMFVANAESVYVVAIAGTNFLSQYDWTVEDFSVKQLVSWPGDGTAMISQGTSDGLTNLNGMTDPTTTQSLIAYLQSVPDPGSAQLIFTGHSLGGALSPALALYLHPALIGAGWNSANIFVYPTAGPTPGNQDFANLFQEAFPSAGGPDTQVWNTLIWNQFDMVPHAWAPETFTAQILNNLYMPKITSLPCVTNLINLALSDPPPQDPYVQIPNQQFMGSPLISPSPAFPDNTCSFLAQVLYQHVYAYYVALAPGLAEILTPINPLDGGQGQSEIILAYNWKIKPKLSPGLCSST